MDEQIQHALRTERIIDITTTGRKSGRPRRIEIWFHNLDDHLYITGTPGPRSWYANVKKNPQFTFHLKQSAQADLPATARPILEGGERREVLVGILAKISDDLGENAPSLEAWVSDSPLVEVTLDQV